MKILLVSPHFPPRYIGGVEIYTKRLADTLRASGDRPEIVAVETIDPSSGIDWVRDDQYGYPVHRLSGRVTLPGERLGESYDNPDLEGLVGQILDHARPDVV